LRLVLKISIFSSCNNVNLLWNPHRSDGLFIKFGLVLIDHRPSL